MDYKKRAKRKIEEILKEKTASSFLDSGSAYGRYWQRNQKRSFDDEKEVMVYIDADNEGRAIEIIVLYNLYHYLVNHLTLDKNTLYLNREFKRYSYSEYMKDENWLVCIEMFLNKEVEVGCSIQNTYNSSNLLSQIIQYSLFTWGEESSNYIILQIHNGCDVRSGYTTPYIFRVKCINDFHLAQFHVEALCKGVKYDPRQTCFKGMEVENTCNNSWSSSDAGMSFIFHGNTSKQKTIEDHTHYDKDYEKLICKNCGSEVIFLVLGDP